MTLTLRAKHATPEVPDAPVAGGNLADQQFTKDTGTQTYATAFDFTGPDLVFSLTTTVTGVSINSSTGVVSVDTNTASLQSGTSIVVRATNTTDHADSGFSLTIAEAGDALSTTSAIVSAALEASPGSSIVLAESWMQAQGLDRLSALTGDKTVLMVGATDFVAVSPNKPNDLDLAVNYQVDYVNSVGSSIAAREHIGFKTHPIWGDSEVRFFGKDFTFTKNAPPFAYSGATPLGLKILDTVVVPGKARAWLANCMRHNAVAHSGLVVWIAECWNGTTTKYYVNEIWSDGGYPAWPGNKDLQTDGMTHLRKLVTLRVVAKSTDDTSPDPFMWTVPTKRLRSSYTPNTTVSTGPALDAAIAALTNASIAPGGNYVIALSAGTYTASGQTYFNFGTSARNALAALTGGRRVVIVGIPDQTIIPALYQGSAVVNVDLCWITFRRSADHSASVIRQIIYAAGGSDIGLYGCIIDGVDGMPTSALTVETTASTQTRFTMADCIVMGCRNGIFYGRYNVGNPDCYIRDVRNFVEVCNDVRRFESGRYLVQATYAVSGGGWMQENKGWQHPDWFQSQPASGGGNGPVSITARYNMLAGGPGFIGDTQWQITNRTTAADLHFVGNIGPSSPGLLRGAEAGGTTGAIPKLELTQNIMFDIPTLIAESDIAPWATTATVVTGTLVLDQVAGHSNLMTQMSVTYVPFMFSSDIEYLPDADTGERAGFSQPDEVFASFPAVTGTITDGYEMDYSGTTHGGTTREGFFSPYDFAAVEAWQTYGAGPGLLSAEDMAGNYTDFPADVETHLGWDGATTPAPADLLEAYSPTAFSLSGSHSNPWGTPRDNHDHEVTVNFRLGGTVGQGKIAEEASGSARWSVEITAGGKVKFEVKNSSGVVTHSVTSRRAVSANSHVLVHGNLLYRDAYQEFINVHVLRLMRAHRANAASYDRVFRCLAQTSAPSAPTVGSGETWFWFDTDDGNRMRTWNGSAWVHPQGDNGVIAAVMAKALANNTSGSLQALSALTLPSSGKIIFSENQTSLTTPASGDIRVYNSAGNLRFQRYSGSAWVSTSQPTLMAIPCGFARCEVRIDGYANEWEADWIWGDGSSNGTLPTGTVTYGDYDQTLRYLELRRGDWSGTAWNEANGWYYRDATCISTTWHFRRTPLDTSTGARAGTLGAPQVWLRSGVSVPALEGGEDPPEDWPFVYSITRDFASLGSSTVGGAGSETPISTLIQSTLTTGGTLYEVGDTVPSSGGVAIYNGGLGGNNNAQILARVNGTYSPSSANMPARLKSADMTIQMGGNYTNSVVPEDQVMVDLAAIVTEIGHDRFVLAHKHYDAISASGARDHTRLSRLNRLSADAYPGRVEDVSLMFNKISGLSGDDLTDQTNDVIPRSLQVDTAHPNSAGNAYIAERCYLPFQYAMEAGIGFVPHQNLYLTAPDAIDTDGAVVGVIPHHPETDITGATFDTGDIRFSAAVESGDIVLRRANGTAITDGYVDLPLVHQQGGMQRTVHQRVRILDDTPSDARVAINSQWMVREKGLSNLVNGGKKFSFAMLLRTLSDGTSRSICNFNTGQGLSILVKTTNKLGITIRNAAHSAYAFNLDSSGSLLASGGWTAVFFSGDTTTGVQTANWYINNTASGSNTPTADAVCDIMTESGTQQRIFSSSDAGASLCDIEVGAMWMAEDRVDWSNSANRDAFRNGTTMRSALTGSGQIAGISPFLWMQGPPGNWSAGLNLAAPGDFWDVTTRAQITAV
jgi:hypothetical protein